MFCVEIFVCNFLVVAVVLRFDLPVCVSDFILVVWASADLLSGEPHLEKEFGEGIWRYLEKGFGDNVRRRGQKFRRDK